MIRIIVKYSVVWQNRAIKTITNNEMYIFSLILSIDSVFRFIFLTAHTTCSARPFYRHMKSFPTVSSHVSYFRARKQTYYFVVSSCHYGAFSAGQKEDPCVIIILFSLLFTPTPSFIRIRVLKSGLAIKFTTPPPPHNKMDSADTNGQFFTTSVQDRRVRL